MTRRRVAVCLLAVAVLVGMFLTARQLKWTGTLLEEEILFGLYSQMAYGFFLTVVLNMCFMVGADDDKRASFIVRLIVACLGVAVTAALFGLVRADKWRMVDIFSIWLTMFGIAFHLGWALYRLIRPQLKKIRTQMDEQDRSNRP